jgi:hypothetical protein
MNAGGCLVTVVRRSRGRAARAGLFQRGAIKIVREGGQTTDGAPQGRPRHGDISRQQRQGCPDDSTGGRPTSSSLRGEMIHQNR